MGDFEDGVDLVFLSGSLGPGGYGLADTSLGALLSINTGGGVWGAFFTGITAAQLSDQIVLA